MTSCKWPEGCERSLDRKGGRGLCATHYHRAFVDGRLDEFERTTRDWSSEEERFFAKVDVSGSCWDWAGRLNNRGYPVFDVGGRNGRPYYAHRWAYEHLVGAIGEGLTIDHLCRRPVCVNPDHLEPVTASENHRRMRATRGWAA